MKLPKKDFKIKIAGFDWTVKYDVAKTDDDNLYGKTDASRQIIYLTANAHTQKIEETLLHEVMHAIFSITKLDQDLKDDKMKLEEEDFILRISPVLRQVIQDNPHIF